MDQEDPEASSRDAKLPPDALAIKHAGSQFGEDGSAIAFLGGSYVFLGPPQCPVSFGVPPGHEDWLDVLYSELPDRHLELHTLQNGPGTTAPSLVGETESTIGSDRLPSLACPSDHAPDAVGSEAPGTRPRHVARTTTRPGPAGPRGVGTASPPGVAAGPALPSGIRGEPAGHASGGRSAESSLDRDLGSFHIQSPRPPSPGRDHTSGAVVPASPVAPALESRSAPDFDAEPTVTGPASVLGPARCEIPSTVAARDPPSRWGRPPARLCTSPGPSLPGRPRPGPGDREPTPRDGTPEPKGEKASPSGGKTNGGKTNGGPQPDDADERPRKRKRSMTDSAAHGRRRRTNHYDDDEDDDSNSDSDRGSPRTNPSRRASGGAKPCFACPFLKRDPVKYRACHHKQLTKISYVKQHIKRAHRQPTHCPRCMAQQAGDEALAAHLRAGTCALVEPRGFDGVSQRQLAQLSRRSDQRKEEVEQWFDIYRILFPGAPRPKSAHLGSDLCDDLIDYILGAGSASLTGVIAERIPQGDKDAVRAAVDEGLRSIFRSWHGNNSRGPAPGGAEGAETVSSPQEMAAVEEEKP